jgi:CheY-like chemotaxis protein
VTRHNGSVALDELTVLLCDVDPANRALTARAARVGGFDVAGETDHLPDALELARLTGPNLVVVTDEIPYAEGLGALRQFKESFPSTEVLLVTKDESIEGEARAAGAFGVLFRLKPDDYEGAFGRARTWLESADERPRAERRTGKDRRQREEWNKVTSERRSGSDRRHPDPD